MVSNSCIAKKLHIRRETVWKVVKKFKETGETCNRPGQGRKRTVRTKRLVKNTREKLRRNSLRSAAKMAVEQESVKLQCVESSKKTSEPILSKCRKVMNFQPLMNIWDLPDVNTFWISWKTEWSPIWCSIRRRNLTFSKFLQFGVEMDQCKAGE